ncbi:hypothetical protein [Paenibacillus gallinarum]|uniref:Regulatory protein YycH-like domain-containing protein n=1 Tax=Paenibacillus gallinarum TaxID=2762232 RepID=A0ABR8T3R7_9BACL|nr:hypothetical protein [Paenibacillus gallinarum]MBD7970183.1 hypothetical protein [Paenibacillus gallinarum]
MKSSRRMELLMISLLMIILTLTIIILFFFQGKERPPIDYGSSEIITESYETMQDTSLEVSGDLVKQPANPYYPNDLAVPLTSDQGRIKDQSSFSMHSIQKTSILIHTNEGEKTFSTPPQNNSMILEAFGSINLSNAKADIAEPSQDGIIYIRFHAANVVYSVPYDLNSNTYNLGGQRYYATYNTIVYMNLFCRPGTILATLGEMRMTDMETEDASKYVLTQNDQYDASELKVQNQNFTEWYDHIKGDPKYIQQMRFYSIRDDKIKTILVDEQNGILFTGLSVFFTKNEVETADGISIGSSTHDVVTRLGQPSKMTRGKWSYQVDEEHYLHFYMKEKKVQFMSLSCL